MRFLVDACAGGKLGCWLVGEGHDIVDLATDGAPGLTDDAVLARAVEEGRILVTLDKDFGELIVQRRHPHRGLVRLPNVRSEERISLMRQVLAAHLDDLSRGAVVTVRGRKVRVSWLRSIG